LHLTWFEELTGFREKSPRQVRAYLTVDGTTITSTVNDRRMQAGCLEIPSLAELRQRVAAKSATPGAISVSEVVADVQDLHTAPDSEGALFQVASQFNLLEMVSPSATPEQGVGIYAGDPTQGPACAIAAGAGTIYRNYFADVNGLTGQTARRQIDCLGAIGEMLGNRRERLWTMKNGYALASEQGLRHVDSIIADMDEAQRDRIRASLHVGTQVGTEVTIGDCGHLVTQIYCSALPVAYAPHPPELWERFARTILEATYEATMAAAVLNYLNTGNNKVYLTLVGGGAFGNQDEWILSAIRRTLDLYESHPLDVKVVSYSGPNPNLRSLLA
jgi:hypothetical protein